MLQAHPEQTAREHGEFKGRWLLVNFRASTDYVCGHQYAVFDRDYNWIRTDLRTRDDCYQSRIEAGDNARVCGDCCSRPMFGFGIRIYPEFEKCQRGGK